MRMVTLANKIGAKNKAARAAADEEVKKSAAKGEASDSAEVAYVSMWKALHNTPQHVTCRIYKKGKHAELDAFDQAEKDSKKLAGIHKVTIYTRLSCCDACCNALIQRMKKYPKVFFTVTYSEYYYYSYHPDGSLILYGDAAKDSALKVLENFAADASLENIKLKIVNQESYEQFLSEGRDGIDSKPKGGIFSFYGVKK